MSVVVALAVSLCYLPTALAGQCRINGTHAVHCAECQTCVPGVGCELEPGFCLIRDAFCQPDGKIMRNYHGTSFCMVCNVSESTTSWVRPRQPTWCSDGLFCNGEDWCELDLTTGQYSSCTGHSGDPCAKNEFCNNTCSEDDKTCERQDRATCKDETDINVCRPDMCIGGECVPTAPDPGLSCGLCGCEDGGLCNTTTGLCAAAPNTAPSLHGGNDNDKYYWVGVGGGITAAAIGMMIPVAQYGAKRRREAKEKSSVYYRVTVGEDSHGEGQRLTEEL